MVPVQSTTSEKKARAARKAALTYRPDAAPLPASISGRVDVEPYWLAAQQYFDAAQRFYQAGDHARGDYCILRGDGYLLLASITIQVHSLGVAPRSKKKSAGQAAVASKVDGKELEAKLQQLQNLLDQQVRPVVPNVPAEAEVANEDVCASYEQEALECLDHALAANVAGTSMNYWTDQARYHELQYQVCQIIVKIVASA